VNPNEAAAKLMVGRSRTVIVTLSRGGIRNPLAFTGMDAVYVPGVNVPVLGIIVSVAGATLLLSPRTSQSLAPAP